MNGPACKQDTVLLVSGDRNAYHSYAPLSPDTDITVLRASRADEALDLVSTEKIPVIIADSHVSGMNGSELLSRVRALSPDTIGVLMVSYADLSTAIDAIYREDAYRFIVKPLDDSTLDRVMQEALQRHRHIRSLESIDGSTLLTLAENIELKDAYTKGHCERVATYALMMADVLGLSDEMKKFVEYGSWLHDCGKIHIPKQILNHNGMLGSEHFDTMKNHPVWGAEIAKYAQLPEKIINIVLFHHERYDGYGYPFGLKQKEIPLEAHIVSIADIFDALTSDRPYRGKYPVETAVTLMRSMRGDILDPEVADIFLCECLKNIR